jgi:hypothetical protein
MVNPNSYPKQLSPDLPKKLLTIHHAIWLQTSAEPLPQKTENFSYSIADTPTTTKIWAGHIHALD